MDRPIRTAFLDRDGVINRKAEAGGYIRTWEEFEFIPGVEEALAMLHAAGIRLIVVTNQRGVERTTVTPESLDDIHRRMSLHLEGRGADLAAILVCPHGLVGCDCRKPRTGLFDQARRLFPDIVPETSIVIGDSRADIEFGNRIGARSFLVGDAVSRSRVATDAPDLVIDAEADDLLALVVAYLVDPFDSGARSSAAGRT